MSAGRTDDDLKLSDEAIAWVVRLNSGTATQQDRAAYLRWRAESPRHENAAIEAESLWHGVGVAVGRKPSAALINRRALLAFGAVGLAGLSAAYVSMPATERGMRLATATGERRSFRLQDGSSLSLNASSRALVDFRPDARRVTLENGQAIFDVARDPVRPFRVTAGGGEIVALGTRFDVDMRKSGVAVTVLGGAVEITQAPGSATQLEAGQQILFGDDIGLARPRPADAEDAAAWQSGRLVFAERPLSDIVAAIARYRRRPLFIASSRLGGLRLTGAFDLDDTDKVLTAMTETLPVKVADLPFATVIY
jgi:transmembrane sensor